MGDSTTAHADKMDAEELSDELGTIQIRSVDDETVIGRVDEIYSRKSDRVKIVATLPNGEEVSEWMDKPLPWSNDFKFSRIVESKGYDASSVHELEGEEIEIHRDGDSWEIADPQPDSRVDGHTIFTSTLAVTGFASILTTVALYTDPFVVFPVGVMIIYVWLLLDERANPEKYE